MTLPIPAPGTSVLSETGTAHYFNANVRDAVNFLLNPPFAIVGQTASQGIPNGAWADLTLDTSTIDTYGGHSTSSNPTQYVVQVPGVYHVIGTVGFVPNSTGARIGGINCGGSYVQQTQQLASSSNYYTIVQVEAVLWLGVGVPVAISAYQSSGAALSTAPGLSGMSIRWLR